MTTPEISKEEFWKSVEEAAKEVAKWPEWKKAGVIAKFEKPI